MRVRYSRFDDALAAAQRAEQLENLFLQMLMHSGGDVNQALKWLEVLADRHGLFGEDLDMEKFKEHLKDRGLITAEAPLGQKGDKKKGEEPILRATRKAEKALRTQAFEEIFSNLKADSLQGGHPTAHAGEGGERLPETRPYVYGDQVQTLDITGSLTNAMKRTGIDDLDMVEDDLMVHEQEQSTSCATVIALDISHSMTLYGEDRITPAKRVALALTELIQTQYTKDSLDCLVFGDRAVSIDPRRIAFIQNGPYHTNTKEALELAQGMLGRRRHANKQIILITDGKPSALTMGDQIYINSFGLDARIVNATVEEAQKCRRAGIMITTFMIASDDYLRTFVERLTEANKGKAYYADLDNLGKFVLADFVQNRRRSV